MIYKGTYPDIFSALKDFPKGAGKEDFVVISGKIHRWSNSRGTWVTDGVHIPPCEEHHPQISLFKEITDGGILVDYMDRRWQLTPYVDRTTTPKITISDVTTDPVYGFDPVEYPNMAGKTDAVKLVEITDSEDDCTIEYKKIVNNVEPEEWEIYTEPFTVKTEGKCKIKARAQKGDEPVSLEAVSKDFNIVRQLLKEEYSAVTISTFKYDKFPADGDTKSPTLSYKQVLTKTYTDGYQGKQDITSGATLTFTGEVTINRTTGAITLGKNNEFHDLTIAPITVTVVLNEISATYSIGIVQEAAAKPKNVITWTKDPSAKTYNVGDAVEFAASALEGDVTFDKQNGFIASTAGTISIKATVADTQNYQGTTSTKTITVNAVQEYVYYGASVGEITSVDTTDKKALTNPIEVAIATELSDKKKCHWVAVKTSSGYRCTKLVDKDNDSVTLSQKVIGEYTVYYYLALGNIANTSKFTLAK